MSARPNRYPGPCTACGCKVDAGAGTLSVDAAGRYVVAHAACPADGAGIPWEARPSSTGGRGRSSRGRYGRRTAYVRCTHEDYPCCGCER